MAEGIPVAKVGDIEDEDAIVVPRATTGTVDDIAIFRSAGEYSAIDNTCTHEDASLAEGWIENGTVECPLHASSFCLRDGKVLGPPAPRGVVAHRVTIDGDRILLIPDPSRLA
ncbi:non-heme iron oxygenase ferredoxin subunit [Pseudoclavibacter endophyticus]|uniref:non-heme iron oxygenase ferredoxin subunit n=1 Tax=Pseudoclavibacter endophyticus TaxID=1778590 RepID=UPI001CE434DD|nr:non-heme iron oxygenase ferredoxin subunit [Pseudoclavibacter endophyticus]